MDITRKEAARLIAQKEISSLSLETRENFLLDWWVLSSDDEDYLTLPADLQRMLAEEEVPGDIDNPKYDPLIVLALIDQYYGVSSQCILGKLEKLYPEREFHVVGQRERMYPCPCCRYMTLRRSAEYSICRVCGWEDDGTEELNGYSHCNKKTLAAARIEFHGRPLPQTARDFDIKSD